MVTHQNYPNHLAAVGNAERTGQNDNGSPRHRSPPIELSDEEGDMRRPDTASQKSTPVKQHSRLSGGPEFHPNFIMSLWEEHGSTTPRISVAIWLPSGISTKDYSFNVSPCGTVLEVHVTWPQVFTDTLLLHKYWLNRQEADGGIRPYHPKIHGFEKHLKTFRAKKTNAVIATGYIDLPHKVETHFDETVFCGWQETPEKVLYVTMRCASDGYGDTGNGTNAMTEAMAPLDDTTTPGGFQM